MRRHYLDFSKLQAREKSEGRCGSHHAASCSGSSAPQIVAALQHYYRSDFDTSCRCRSE